MDIGHEVNKNSEIHCFCIAYRIVMMPNAVRTIRNELFIHILKILLYQKYY